MFNRGSSMVRNQQLMTSRHVMCVMLPSLLLFITSFSMDIKADTTIQLAGTNPITQEETSITSSKAMTNDFKNDKSSQQKSASTAIPKPSNVIDQPMVINDSGVLNEGKAISTLDLDDTKPLKTFNYSVHNFVVVKPVTGLANHSQNIVTRLKQLYISYKQNYTSPLYGKDSEENVEVNYQSKSSDDSAEVVIEEDMNEYYHAEFERWNNRRLMDGLLCQNDSQCEWLDWKLRCKTDIEFNFEINVGIRIAPECCSVV